MRLSERFISMNIFDNEKYISTTKYEIATKKQQDKFFLIPFFNMTADIDGYCLIKINALTMDSQVF